MKLSKMSIAVTCALCAAGCGGGGGGGGGGSHFVSGGTRGLVVPRSSVVAGDLTGRVATNGSFSASTNGSTLNASGDWSQGEKSGQTWNYGGAVNGPGTEFPITNSDHTGSLVILTASGDGASMTFLPTTTNTNDGTGAVGVFYTGNQTPSQAGRTDTVFYDGVTAGRRYTTGETSTLYEGDADISANFNTGRVNGNFAGLNGGTSAFSFNNAEMQAGKSTYSSTGATTFAYGGAPATGQLEGAFFRPDGSETSGVYMIDAGGSGDRLVGGYTAGEIP